MHTQQQRGSDIKLASMEQNTDMRKGRHIPEWQGGGLAIFPKSKKKHFTPTKALAVCWSLGLRRSTVRCYKENAV